MKIVVDTSVWSLALRRKSAADSPEALRLRELIEAGEQIQLLGVIVQELLSGIQDKALFRRLDNYLGAFPILKLERDDFVEAARLANTCRRQGVVVGTIDYLIASVCVTRDLLLFTTDKDFEHIARICSLRLLPNS